MIAKKTNGNLATLNIAVLFLLAVAFLSSTSQADESLQDPNLLPRVQQFIYQPSPDELIDTRSTPDEERSSKRKRRHQSPPRAKSLR
jgi:hypothetical protein